MTFTVLKPPAVSWSRDPQVARDNTWAHIINKHSGRPFSLTGSAHESMHSRHRLFGGPIPSRPTKTLESTGALTKHTPRRSWLYLHGPTVSVYLMNFHVLRSERLKHWGKPRHPGSQHPNLENTAQFQPQTYFDCLKYLLILVSFILTFHFWFPAFPAWDA